MPRASFNTNGTFGTEVGEVELRNFDLGLITSLGGTLVGKQYVLNYTGLEENIPIIFENPEQSFGEQIIPSMIILRDDVSLVQNARLQRKDIEYRIPSDTAQVVTHEDDTTGYSEYTVKPNAWATDITYSIQIYHRYRNLIQVFLRRVLEILLLGEYITVTDSNDVSRLYSAFIEGGPTKLDEFTSVASRVLGFSISLRVEAELDVLPISTESDIISKNLDITRSVI